MPTEKTETPNVADLIAEAVGAPADEGVTPPADPVDPPADAPPAEPADPVDPPGDAPPSDEPPGDPVEEPSPEDAAVTKEMADLGITKPDSQARFRELANQAKEANHYRERYEQQQEVFDHLDKQGVTGEQFGLMVMIAGDVNSNDPVRLKRAYDALSAELTGLSKMLGLEAPGFDPLSAYQDLSRKVEEGEIDRATALAWAKDRRQAALAQENNQRRTRQDTAVQVEDRARQDLTELGNQLQQKDPFYDKVYAMLVPALRPVLARTPPNEWVNVTVDAYRNLRQQMQSAGQLVKEPPKPVAKRPDPANAGRPNGTAGAPAPKNAADAIMASLGMSPEV